MVKNEQRAFFLVLYYPIHKAQCLEDFLRRPNFFRTALRHPNDFFKTINEKQTWLIFIYIKNTVTGLWQSKTGRKMF